MANRVVSSAHPFIQMSNSRTSWLRIVFEFGVTNCTHEWFFISASEFRRYIIYNFKFKKYANFYISIIKWGKLFKSQTLHENILNWKIFYNFRLNLNDNCKFVPQEKNALTTLSINSRTFRLSIKCFATWATIVLTNFYSPLYILHWG